MIRYKDLDLESDKIKLLYIISKYSTYDKANRIVIWAKEMTVLAAIFRVLRYDLPVQQHILTIKYSQKNESEKQTEIAALRPQKIFETYRFTPTYRVYHGNYRLMNISVDAIEDLAEMVKAGLIQKFKIGTSKFIFENSFILTPIGYQVLKECASDDDPAKKIWKNIIDTRLGCTECQGAADIVLLEDKIGFLCQKFRWKHFDPSLIFLMQDIEYITEPFQSFNEKEGK